MYKLELSKEAKKFIKKQDKKTQARLIQGLEGITKFPPEGDISAMQRAKGLYRLRVGTYRIIFEYDEATKTVIVHAIGNRGDVY